MSFFRSSNSFAFFLAALDLAVDLAAFVAAFLERVEAAEDAADFFRAGV